MPYIKRKISDTLRATEKKGDKLDVDAYVGRMNTLIDGHNQQEESIEEIFRAIGQSSSGGERVWTEEEAPNPDLYLTWFKPEEEEEPVPAEVTMMSTSNIGEVLPEPQIEPVGEIIEEPVDEPTPIGEVVLTGEEMTDTKGDTNGEVIEMTSSDEPIGEIIVEPEPEPIGEIIPEPEPEPIGEIIE